MDARRVRLLTLQLLYSLHHCRTRGPAQAQASRPRGAAQPPLEKPQSQRIAEKLHRQPAAAAARVAAGALFVGVGEAARLLRGVRLAESFGDEDEVAAEEHHRRPPHQAQALRRQLEYPARQLHPQVRGLRDPRLDLRRGLIHSLLFFIATQSGYNTDAESEEPYNLLLKPGHGLQPCAVAALRPLRVVPSLPALRPQSLPLQPHLLLLLYHRLAQQVPSRLPAHLRLSHAQGHHQEQDGLDRGAAGPRLPCRSAGR